MMNRGTTDSSDSLMPVIPATMFPRINSVNGSSLQKVSPLQTVSSKATYVNSLSEESHVDFMGIEEFLSSYRDRAGSSDVSIQNASIDLVARLKESRALLSLASYLSSEGTDTVNILDRLMDTAYFILNAENVYLLQLETPGSDTAVVTHTHCEGAVGVKCAGQEQASDSDKASAKVSNVCEGGRIPPYILQLDKQTGSKTRNLIKCPIIVDGKMYGSVLATNRVSQGEELFGNKERGAGGTGGAGGGRDKDKEKGIQPPFGPNEEILLKFIATNAGLALKYTTMHNGVSASNLSTRRSPKLPSSDTDTAMQQLVDAACADLEADLISVFTYNDASKRLQCTVSKDIKGISIPIDRGIAGTSFRMGRVINVKEIASDDRHNHDVDAQVGYKTQTLLCAPIMDVTGRPVGVMQALNKKGATHFTQLDENLICAFCKQVSGLLQDADYLRDCSDNCNAVLVAKFLSAFASCHTVAAMVQEVRRLAMGAVACDFVGLYSYVASSDGIGEHLLSQDYIASSRDGNRILLKDAPSQIVDALRSGISTELSISKANKLSSKLSNKNAHENFIPGVSARHALIYPINAKSETDTYALVREDRDDDASSRAMSSSSVLVVIRGSQSLLPFSTAARDVMDLFVAVLGPSMERVMHRQALDTTMAGIESNFQLANNTLGTLQDYILVINSAGNVIKWNRDFSPLLGTKMQVDEAEEGEVRHYSQWFKASDCQELVADIMRALQSAVTSTGAVSIVSSAALCSFEHPEGVHVDYQLFSLDGVGVLSEEEGNPIVLVVRIKDEGERAKGSSHHSFQHHEERSGERSGEKMDKIQRYNESRTSTPESNAQPQVDSDWSTAGDGGAREMIDAAAGLLKSVRTKCTISTDMQKELDDLTSNLDILSPKLSIAAERKTSRKEKVHYLVSPEIVPPEDLFSWDFNVLRVKDRNGLVNSLGLIFESLHLLDSLGIDPLILANYIRDVSGRYHDNPFHNLHHATYVTQFAYMLIHATDADKYLSPRQLFGVVLSAVVHDVDHPGNTNMFEINSQSSLSLLYNDQSVLENHHCSTAFQLMRKPSCNIFIGLSKSTALEMRKIIVTCVMATDMSVHFELVDETKKIVSEGDFSFTDLQDQMFLCKLLVHSADLSNPVRPFHITQAWARRISAEFNLQVAKEQKLNMPVLNFMMTPDDKALCKNETGFASFVVAPMWRSLSSLFPGLVPLVRQLDSNLLSWKTMLEKIVKEEEADKSVGVSASGKYVQSG